MSDETNNLPVARPKSAVARKRDERVRRRVRRLRKSAVWLDDPRYAILLPRYCGLSVLFDRLCEDVRKKGILNDLGEVRPIVGEIRKLAQTLLGHERELLLTALAGSQALPRDRDVFGALAALDAKTIEVASTAASEEGGE